MSTPDQQILGPPPAGSDWRTKMLWILADTVATGIIYNLFDYSQPIQPTQASPDDPEASSWMHVQVQFDDNVSQDTADICVFSLDILKVGNQLTGESVWTSNDFTFVKAQIDTFVNSILDRLATRMTYTKVTFYRRAFLPYPGEGASEADKRKAFADAGGPSWVGTGSGSGTASGNVPPQACSTITERTPSRKHWGRFYLPTIGGTALDSSGRVSAATLVDLADAYQAMLTGLGGIGFHLVVPTTSSGGIKDVTKPGDWTTVPTRTLQMVNGCSVDDIVDIIRRRRHKTVMNRHVRPTEAELAGEPYVPPAT